MEMTFGKRLLLTIACCGATVCLGSSLEELLRPGVNAATLSSTNANAAWREVVEAFHRNDMDKAVELGKAFLAADHKPSAFQLMGVKVMIGLAGGSESAGVFENPEDIKEKKALEQERATITKRYQELTVIYQQADARINELTLNRRRPVQEGSPNHLECVQCAGKMDAAMAEMNAMKPAIEKNKERMAALDQKSGSSLKPQTLQLLDMLIEANEIEAAAAIANTYIRKIGNDLEVAKKQQDLVRLQEVAAKASQVIEILKKEAGPLVTQKLYWAAKRHTENFEGKVKLMSNDEDLRRMVKAQISLDPLGIEQHLAAGDRSFAVIKGEAKVDFGKAFREYEAFKATYPDYPDTQALDALISKEKVFAIDRLLAELEAEYGEVERRFDPEKLRVFFEAHATAKAERTAFLDKETVTAEASQKKLLEMGLAPGDSRLMQSKLQGLAAAVSLLEKMGPPEDRMVKFVSLKGKIQALKELTS